MSTVVVTGAVSGIGRGIALGAAARGRHVALLDIDERALEDAAAAILDAGAASALPLVCDVSDEHEVDAAFGAIVDRMPVISGVVANAGIEVSEPLADASVESWERVMAVNLRGTFLTSRAAVGYWRDQRSGGSLVCISSPSAFVGFAGGGNTAYGASKGGISAFVRAAALDAAPDGVRVNAVVPGATDTDILYFGLEGEALSARRAELEDAAKRQIPLGRMARPEEIADAVLWLLSEESAYVTGTHLVCDGGLLAKSANTF
ncbi:SDR family NAD(P)-dependent oxidoreductase [Microbacterium halotolerans]|uniref:SDR family NAD(P)-dependent oxidoreductase n=1 Tax=Microbacterium halotolerans TaxID=246613 RepID=UPI001968FEB5|nr:SDR family NAD(P)-dependent oxidoreductase [Microbacterium halotolerans]